MSKYIWLQGIDSNRIKAALMVDKITCIRLYIVPSGSSLSPDASSIFYDAGRETYSESFKTEKEGWERMREVLNLIEQEEGGQR